MICIAQPPESMTFASRLGTLALATLLPALAQSQTLQIPKEPAASTEYVANALRNKAGDVPVTVTAPLKLQVGKMQLDLHRLADACRMTPQNCAPDIDMFAKGNVEAVKSGAMRRSEPTTCA